MTPANNCPPSMYVWKGGNSFLGGRGGSLRVVWPFPGPLAQQGDPYPVWVKSATQHGTADKPKHCTRFPPPGGEEIAVRHGASSAGYPYHLHRTVTLIGPEQVGWPQHCSGHLGTPGHWGIWAQKGYRPAQSQGGPPHPAAPHLIAWRPRRRRWYRPLRRRVVHCLLRFSVTRPGEGFRP